jgi:class 3 adenylate cyclase
VLVTSTTHDLVAGGDLEFEDRGPQELKGIPEPWKLFSVTS